MDNLKRDKLGNFLNEHVSSIIFLILVTIIVSLITYWRVMIQIDIGPLSDSIDFFTNALVFAGQDMGYSDLMRPPFFSFITAIFVKMGYTSINTVFAVDGGFFVFGVIGFYLLLKTRFNDMESFLGSLIYATFPIVLAVVGAGFSDLSSVSLTIWTFYFTILAVKNDSRFFYLSFPFAMLAFLARYNSALIIFPILLYIFINWDYIKINKFQNVRNILIGMFASVMVLIPVLIFFYIRFDNLFFPFINFAGSSSNPLSTQNASYDPNLLFFLEKFPYFIGIQGVLIILIIITATFIYLIMRKRKNLGVINGSDIKVKNLLHKLKFADITTKIKFTIFVALLIVFLVSFGHVVYMISEVIFFILIYLSYDNIKNLRIKYLDIDILFLAWFMVFFIFHSIYVIKDNRYFVIMAPPVAYFLILGLRKISNLIHFNIKNRNLTFPLIAVMITLLVLLTTISSLPIIYKANNDTKVTNERMEIISEWFVNYDPEYKNKNIYSDMWPNFSWHLNTNVKMVPIFKDNVTYSNGIKNNTFSPEDSLAFDNFLVKNNAYYYLSIRQGLNLTSYIPIKQFGNLIIYKKKS